MTNVEQWRRHGAIRPTPATQHLWDMLRDAKLRKDKAGVCALSEQIRRALMDASKERR